MKIKKLAAVALAAVMSLSLMACSVDGETKSSDSEGGSGSIGLAVSTLSNPFFVSLQEGAEAKAEELGVELYVTDAGDDAAVQTSNVEDLISKGISVLIVNPVDSDAIAPAVEDAIAAGIKVIAVDRVVNGVEVDCSIASDNVMGAELATEYIVELVGEGAEVAELQGVTGASATNDRGEGFHNVADTKLNVVASQTASFDRAEGMTVMENILQAQPGIKAVFAHNDEMALGAVEACAGKDIVIVGFDATDDALAAVEAGTMAGTIAQQPELMGATAVETAVKLINGETVEKELPVEVTLVK